MCEPPRSIRRFSASSCSHDFPPHKATSGSKGYSSCPLSTRIHQACEHTQSLRVKNPTEPTDHPSENAQGSRPEQRFIRTRAQYPSTATGALFDGLQNARSSLVNIFHLKTVSYSLSQRNDQRPPSSANRAQWTHEWHTNGTAEGRSRHPRARAPKSHEA